MVGTNNQFIENCKHFNYGFYDDAKYLLYVYEKLSDFKDIIQCIEFDENNKSVYMQLQLQAMKSQLIELEAELDKLKKTFLNKYKAKKVDDALFQDAVASDCYYIKIQNNFAIKHKQNKSVNDYENETKYQEFIQTNQKKIKKMKKGINKKN